MNRADGKTADGAQAPKAKAAALRLLHLHPHWRVFRVGPGTKDKGLPKQWPTIGNTGELDKVGRWRKDCNVGIAIARSYLLVLDFDHKHGTAPGLETFARLDEEHGFPETLRTDTPSGGFHLFYQQTSVVRHRQTHGALGPGVDTPGYVLLPGSVVPAGMYRCADLRTPVAPAPAWLADYLKDHDPTVRTVPVVELDRPGMIEWAVQYLKADAPPAIEGEHGERTLLMVAATLKDRGISQQLSIELLAEHYNPRCQPEWDIGDGAIEDRLDVKVENAWLYLTANAPGSRTSEYEFGDDPPEQLTGKQQRAAERARNKEIKRRAELAQRRRLRGMGIGV